MSSPYVGEIRLVSWPFAPIGWSFCNGALLAISEYEALFELIGTTYGGNGVQSFALPDLRGRAPMHFNSLYPMGAITGIEDVTLLTSQMPSHHHQLKASKVLGGTTNPQASVLAATANATYAPPPGFPTPMSAFTTIVPSSSTSHNNMQPYLVANFIISLYGIYPQQA